jgi:hypothetical protein
LLLLLFSVFRRLAPSAHPFATVGNQGLGIFLLSSPFVAVACALCAGIANIVCARRLGKKLLPIVVVAPARCSKPEVSYRVLLRGSRQSTK